MSVYVSKDSFEKREFAYFVGQCDFPYQDDYGTKKERKFFRISEKGYRFPFAMWKEIYDENPFPEGKKVALESSIKLTFRKGVDQKEVCQEAVDHLNDSGCCFLNIPTGVGKTSMAIVLACSLKRKTIIVCGLTLTLSQWIEAFRLGTSITPQYITTKSPIKSDVVVCTPHTFIKRSGDLKDYKTIICDEMHIETEKILTGLLKYNCEYLIGLTATLQRGDGLVGAIRLYFGETFIQRQDVKKGVAVYRVLTDYCPTPKTIRIGRKTRLDYTDLINQLCCNTERNGEITKHIFEYLSEGKTGLKLPPLI